MSRAEDMRHILDQVQNVTVNEEMGKYRVVLIDDQGNEIDSVIYSAGSLYAFDAIKQWSIQLKKGWKIELQYI